MKNLVHLYWGDGKGKTTAAMGLALRALGHGGQVTVLQFLKDGHSGEIALLQKLGARVYAGKPEPGFTWQLTGAEKRQVLEQQNQLLGRALREDCSLLVLDEACAALESGLVDEELLKTAVLQRPAGREVVLTGRSPAAWMFEAADYVTEMRCGKHPFERGIPAWEGVEY